MNWIFLLRMIGSSKNNNEIMENAVDLEVPNKVDYESGPNWGTIK